jgi:hypothetical protein
LWLFCLLLFSRPHKPWIVRNLKNATKPTFANETDKWPTKKIHHFRCLGYQFFLLTFQPLTIKGNKAVGNIVNPYIEKPISIEFSSLKNDILRMRVTENHPKRYQGPPEVLVPFEEVKSF